MTEFEYDLLAIGSGPAGQKGAIAAAKLGKRVAVIDRREMLGGVSLHTGTIPSKTVREAILYFSGFRQRSFYGKDYQVKDNISVADLGFRVEAVLQHELGVLRAQFKRNRITQIYGTAHFTDPHTLQVETAEGPAILKSEHILIACGTRPAHCSTIALDGERIIDADQVRSLKE